MPSELEHKAFWAIKQHNLDHELAGKRGLMQLNELEEFRLSAYENAKLYKENTKRWHDRKIIDRRFGLGQQVLLFNSRLKLFPGNLKSCWSGPFMVTEVFLHGTIEVAKLESGRKFKVNGQQLKHYWGGGVDCQQTSITLG